MEYCYYPKTLNEALDILNSNDTTIYAGGTDLMVRNVDESYMFISQITDLHKIEQKNNYISIGSCVTFSEAYNNKLIPNILKKCIEEVSGPAIRNYGTLGGNISNASSKADSVVIFYLLNAKLVLKSFNNERIVNIDDFYLGNRKTILNKNEILTEILIPIDNDYEYVYDKVSLRKTISISKVCFAGLYKIDNNTISMFSISIGAISDKIQKFNDIESLIIGKTINELNKQSIIENYMNKLVINKGRVPEEYRYKVTKNLISDFLDKIIL